MTVSRQIVHARPPTSLGPRHDGEARRCPKRASQIVRRDCGAPIAWAAACAFTEALVAVAAVVLL